MTDKVQVQMIPVGNLADGTQVLMSSNRSRGAIKANVEPYMREVLGMISPFHQRQLKVEVNLERTVGVTDCTQIRSYDTVVWAMRRGPSRGGLFPFVLDRERPATSFVTVTLKRNNGDLGQWFEVVAGYIGRIAPPMPWMKGGDNEHSREFWSTNALAYRESSVIVDTVTDTPPDWVLVAH